MPLSFVEPELVASCLTLACSGARERVLIVIRMPRRAPADAWR